MASPASPRRSALAWLATGVGLLLAAVLAVYFLNPFGTASGDPRARLLGYVTYRIASSAMAPTLAPGDFVMVDSKAFSSSGPTRGDVVVYLSPDSPGPMIHRVVAVAGEQVELRAGQLVVDGRPQPLPPGAGLSTDPGHGRDMAPQIVPADHIFVLGDNRDHSLDSRYIGPVPNAGLVGRMVRVLR